ncbi:MAG TPA: DUF6755 family protein [Fimbriimonadaceae bacterium]|nr:DUF6755 family protein [Fimbriimonadaceae bacterium]
MKRQNLLRHRQQAVVFVSLLLFNLVLVLIQLWLFVTVLENFLGGHIAMAIPAAVTSLVILGLNMWMLRGIEKIERAS